VKDGYIPKRSILREGGGEKKHCSTAERAKIFGARQKDLDSALCNFK
jgi:hypothetical protein